MWGSTVLEIALGLVFVYIVLAVLCSTIGEWIASVWKLRAMNLDVGIRNLLDEGGTGLSKAFWEHSLITALREPRKGTYHLPSYIPSGTFSTAMLDEVGLLRKLDPDAAIQAVDADPRIPSCVKRTLKAFIVQADGDLQKLQNHVASWFDASMDRVSGWYKRKIQLIIMFIASVVVLCFNADTLAIVQKLNSDANARASLASSAVAFAGQNSELPSMEAQKAIDNLYAKPIPIGWDSSSLPSSGQPVLLWFLAKVAGLFVTVAAVSLGAQFWFGVLNKVVRIRAAGDPPAAVVAASPSTPPGT